MILQFLKLIGTSGPYTTVPICQKHTAADVYIMKDVHFVGNFPCEYQFQSGLTQINID